VLKLKNKIFRYWTYFKQGHANYFSFILSVANFLVIQYMLLVERLNMKLVASILGKVPYIGWILAKTVEVLAIVLSRFTFFALLFFMIYAPICIAIGWLDFKRGTVPVDAAVRAFSNPWVNDLAKALILICDEKYDEAKKLLRRWIK